MLSIWEILIILLVLLVMAGVVAGVIVLVVWLTRRRAASSPVTLPMKPPGQSTPAGAKRRARKFTFIEERGGKVRVRWGVCCISALGGALGAAAAIELFLAIGGWRSERTLLTAIFCGLGSVSGWVIYEWSQARKAQGMRGAGKFPTRTESARAHPGPLPQGEGESSAGKGVSASNSPDQMPGSCPRCGATLPADAPQGLCPRCVLGVGLATHTEATGESGPHGTKVVQPPPEPAEIAKHFPQLEILECLGRGGMGVVYKARQPKLNRLVALKILAPEKGADPKFAERFLREAQALARLSHPNIVTVHDFGEAEGLYYLLMEYVDGMTLRQLLHGQKIAPEEALSIVPKICEALQFAHEQGVVHRDIKPENVLVDRQGRVKIADFGIAKIVAADQPRQAITQDQVIGTPHYMAPEQVEKPQLVDHRADIYSLGVVFYEMLTGELPLGKFQPPSRKVQVDVRLDEVVLHALEKEPERRYQHASEVKTAVETIAATPGAPAAAAPAGPPEITPAMMSPQPVSRAMTGLMFLLGSCWLLLAIFELLGKKVARTEPLMYAFFGLGGWRYPDSYNAVIVLSVLLGLACLWLGWMGARGGAAWLVRRLSLGLLGASPWLVVMFALILGKKTVRWQPDMYAFFGVGGWMYPSTYNLLIGGCLLLALATFGVIWLSAQKHPEATLAESDSDRTAAGRGLPAAGGPGAGPPVVIKRWRDAWPWSWEYIQLYLIVPAAVVGLALPVLLPRMGLKALWLFAAELGGIAFAITYAIVDRQVRRARAEVPRTERDVAECLMFRRPFQSPGLAVMHEDRLELIPIVGSPITVPLADIVAVKEVRWFNGTRLWFKKGFVMDLANGQRVGVAVAEVFARRWRAKLSRGALPEIPVGGGMDQSPLASQLWRVARRAALVAALSLLLLETLLQLEVGWRESTGELWTMALYSACLAAMVWAAWPLRRQPWTVLLRAGAAFVLFAAVCVASGFYTGHLRPNLGLYREPDWIAQHPAFQREWRQRIEKNLWRKPAVSPTKTTSFGPVTERVLYSVATQRPIKAEDLDAGREIEVPPEIERAGEDQFFHWLAAQGADVLAFGHKRRWALWVSPTLLASVPAEVWDQPAAAGPLSLKGGPVELRRAEPDAKEGFVSYLLETNAAFPLTFVFQTKAHAAGVLQLTGLTENPPGMRIRYRLMQSAGQSGATSGGETEPVRQKFVRLVVDKAAMTFEDQPTTWEGVGALLEKLTDRTNTVLECAVTSDQITVQQQNEWWMKSVLLARNYGFKYASFVGIKELGSAGTPATGQSAARVIRPPEFGPAIERELGGWPSLDCTVLDLDQGRLLVVPTNIVAASINNPRPLLNWMVQQGADLTVAMGAGAGLHLDDGVLLRLAGDATFENVGASTVRRQLGGGGAQDVSIPRAEVQAQPVFVYRTREGGMGVLQVLGLSQDPHNLRIRFKAALSLK